VDDVFTRSTFVEGRARKGSTGWTMIDLAVPLRGR